MWAPTPIVAVLISQDSINAVQISRGTEAVVKRGCLQSTGRVLPVPVRGRIEAGNSCRGYVLENGVLLKCRLRCYFFRWSKHQHSSPYLAMLEGTRAQLREGGELSRKSPSLESLALLWINHESGVSGRQMVMSQISNMVLSDDGNIKVASFEWI